MNDFDRKKNLYEILEIKQNASKDEIKKAYKKLIFQYHPDKNNNSLYKQNNKFIEVKNAYDILSNDEQKNRYDKFILSENTLNNDKNIDMYNIFDLDIIEKIKNILIKIMDNPDINKIFLIIIKKKISFVHLKKLFLDLHSELNISNLKKEILNIDLIIDVSLKDLYHGNSININYNRVSKDNFNEEIFPFDLEQIYEGEGEKIKFNNIEFNGDLIIKINIIDTEINKEYYYIYKNELYMLINHKRIIDDKFNINFLDGYEYKFNLKKLNCINNDLGSVYVKKNFGLINYLDNSNITNDNILHNGLSHGNLYFIVVI